MAQLRDDVYWWCLDLVKRDLKLQAIFLLLSTWNFAYFRYVLTDFDVADFEKMLDSCDFDFFEDRKFETCNLNDEEISRKVKSIYGKLSGMRAIKYVGASKIMHLLNPAFFVMWDKQIIKYYKAKVTPEGYLNFMKQMQERYKNNEFKELEKEVTIPRAIDLYNMALPKK